MSSFYAMLARCKYRRRGKHPHYAGRGIKVCERWKDKRNGFRNFLADMGLRPSGFSLDRIDVDGHYEPINCRWATKQEQAINKRARSA